MHKDNDPVESYSTKDILHDYIPLMQDFPDYDELLDEMRAVLVSRHRFLNPQETAEAPTNWSGGLVDETKYIVSASIIFEVDKAMFDFYGSFCEGILHQKVPLKDDALETSYGVVTTNWQYLIGMTVDVMDILCYNITEEVAKKIIDSLLIGGGDL